MSSRLSLRIDEVVEDASNHFWKRVAALFPEATTGDFPPHLAQAMHTKMKDYVTEWVRDNTNLMPYTPDSYEWFEAITAHLRRMGYEVAADETGGGIVCIIVKIGLWYLWFGTANENWGSDVWFDDEFIDGANLEVDYPSDSVDTFGCAHAISNAIEHFKAHKPEVPAHTHTCQQCDRVLRTDCHCEHGFRTNEWCSANCKAAYDL